MDGMASFRASVRSQWLMSMGMEIWIYSREVVSYREDILSPHHQDCIETKKADFGWMSRTVNDGWTAV